MKRFVICFDGTWQKLRQDKPTNIAIIARSIAHTHTLPDGSTIPQIVIYSQGVGSNVDALGKDGFMDGFSEWLNRMLGGVFGEGLEDNIVETYLRLAFNYEEGDEIYVFGFSRGAFCARSFAGLIGSAGIVSRLHAEKAWDAFRLYRAHPKPKATKFELEDFDRARRDFRASYGKGKRAMDGSRIKSDEPPKVTYLGIFETVGQRGVPSVLGGMARFFNRRFGFHDMTIGAGVMAARHAVAVDENRLGFPPTLWEGIDDANKRPHCSDGKERYAQRWFIGTHGDVGGGEGSALSAAPLKWIAEGAVECGLRFYGTYGEDESPLAQAVREAGLIFDARISRPRFWDSLSPMNYPIYTRQIWKTKSRKDGPTVDYAASILDATVKQRMEDMNLKPRYNPGPLRVFRSILIPPPPKPLKGKKAKMAAAHAEAAESAELETPLVDAQMKENRAE